VIAARTVHYADRPFHARTLREAAGDLEDHSEGHTVAWVDLAHLSRVMEAKRPRSLDELRTMDEENGTW
jgi:hypothetical protein